jgi:pimeloyl-ACP methyl ester carboxylesterase
MLLGFKQLGSGSEKVIILHDWFCDSSSYESLLPYLDLKNYHYIFPDLRGYGRSQTIEGQYNLEEATSDILELIDSLHFSEVHLVGHSMTSLVMQNVAAKARDRVKSLIAIAPVPACGSPQDDNTYAFMKDAAGKNDENAKQIVNMMTGGRYSNEFLNYKVNQWRNISSEEARINYLEMFTGNDISVYIKGMDIPCLVITGENDIEGHNKSTMENTFGKWFKNCDIQTIHDAGHHPMQETPVLLLSKISNFLAKHV